MSLVNLSSLSRGPGRRLRRPVGLVLLAALAAAGLVPSGAQAQRAPTARLAERASQEVRVYAYTFLHQRAAEALVVVQPLLSSQGSVELRPQDNTLVVRDTAPALTSVVKALREFDQPPRVLRVEVMIVEANRASYSPVVPEDQLPETLLARLKKVLPYSAYRILARTKLWTREGERVLYEVGAGFSVSFQSGRVDERQKVQLQDFKVARQLEDGAQPLIHSALHLRLDQPMTLALAPAEASNKALVVVLVPSLETADLEDR